MSKKARVETETEVQAQAQSQAEPATSSSESLSSSSSSLQIHKVKESPVEVDVDSHEVIDWTNDSLLAKFKLDVIRPHIYEQEGVSLSFMYYLDYVRAYAPQWALSQPPLTEETEATKATEAIP